MLLPRGALNEFAVYGSYPLRNRKSVAHAVCSENYGNCAGAEEHVYGKRIVDEGVVGNRKDSQTITYSEQSPRKRPVLVRISPHKADGWDCSARIGNNREIKYKLCLRSFVVNEAPPHERGDANCSAYELPSLWLSPYSSPQCEHCDENGVEETEDGRPNIARRAGTAIGEQECKAEKRPDAPAHEVRLNLSLENPNRVGNDADHNNQTSNLTNRFCVQATPPFLSTDQNRGNDGDALEHADEHGPEHGHTAHPDSLENHRRLNRDEDDPHCEGNSLNAGSSESHPHLWRKRHRIHENQTDYHHLKELALQETPEPSIQSFNCTHRRPPIYLVGNVRF
ncbi:hypothetical protein COT82_00115 [Candidatus Campbellbacteria bacterium CG10_big_fil_rev_8_21_14_0_10_35_52]|uniref:Uncharacterized protein n=1 Tax=Candidatus Campbellbacteria bacterium CG10_big_fil_rev_8_21_14_0_10_35_52 TaxID=1974527 RepID=A0A2M6WW22_9BACT|nr:MAG: hypothetical protein COT82_00115 [Candidatus Campbellbacteria bacterium CG10_big_fil_rev_8_21_14_0_10_35_52]